jgi:hypothetical protein
MPLLRHHLARFSAKLFAINSSRIPPQHKPPSGAKSGLGDLWGTLIGGVILGVAQTLGARINPGYQILTGHLVFLAILTLRPRGFLAKIY